ncbi:MAG: DUF4174 domain-containing protein [Paracoccaceae bacterium]
MKPVQILALAALLPLAAMAQAADPVAPIPATEADPASFLWHQRPIVVFANTPEDANFIRQIELLSRAPADLAERDAVVITDTDPAARSPFRQQLRPNGFAIIVLDKDGKPLLRKPLPRDVREITHTIDRSPLRRQEMLERRPAGR